jgi:DEAD/DEAH box helicase domain-containing protein
LADKPAQDGFKRFAVLDLETQCSAQQVGGWRNADCMKVSCAVLYDSDSNAFEIFYEEQVPELITYLQRMDVVVGFNIKRV